MEEKDIVSDIKEELKQKKMLPQNIQERINTVIFRNIILAIIIMLYLYFLNLGFLNIEKSSYMTDLKVFSVGLIITTVLVFEVAYKKDSGQIAIHGIEVLVLALVTLFAIHIYSGIPHKYIYLLSSVSYFFGIYYLVKSIVIYKKRRKVYTIENMKKITNKNLKKEEYDKERVKENVNKKIKKEEKGAKDKRNLKKNNSDNKSNDKTRQTIKKIKERSKKDTKKPSKSKSNRVK